jgi:hypothetical protein
MPFLVCYTYQSDIRRESWELLIDGELVEVAGHTNAFCGSAMWISRVGLLFLGRSSVQSGRHLPAFWKQEVHTIVGELAAFKTKQESVRLHNVYQSTKLNNLSQPLLWEQRNPRHYITSISLKLYHCSCIYVQLIYNKDSCTRKSIYLPPTKHRVW